MCGVAFNPHFFLVKILLKHPPVHQSIEMSANSKLNKREPGFRATARVRGAITPIKTTLYLQLECRIQHTCLSGL